MDTVVSEAPAAAQTPVHAERSCIITVEHIAITGVEILDGQRYLRELIISGWMVCKDAVEQLVFEHQGLILGVAALGIQRPDVAAAYPYFPGSGHAGFTAAISHVKLVNGSLPTINASVRTRGGRRYGGRLQIQTSGVARGALRNAASEVAGSALPMEGVVDVAVLDASGFLRVEGWALSPSDIVSVRVLARDQLLGLATSGLARSDVAQSHPQYPHARDSGFEFQARLNEKQVAELKSVQVEVIGRNGEVKTIVADLAGAKTREQVAVEMTSVAPGTLGAGAAVEGPMTSTIRWSCDLAEVTRRGTGYASGWAVSPHGIRSISLLCGGRALGSARLGLARDDVGVAIPDIADSALSGFEVHFDLGRPVEGECTCTLRVEDGSGDAVESSIPLRVGETLSRNINAPAEATQSAADDFRMILDSPANHNGVVTETLTGAATVSGWVLARHGVKSVDIYLGDDFVGQAKLGFRRPDIAAAFPDWPDSLQSGFALFVPSGKLKDGKHKLTIELTGRHGGKRRESILVEVQKSAAGKGDRPLRRKVSAAETDVGLRIVRQAGVMPRFSLVMAIGGEDRIRDALPVTLASVAAQTYPHWRLFLLTVNAKGRKRLAELKATMPEGIRDKVELLTRLDESFASLHNRLPCPDEVNGDVSYVVHLHAGDELAADALLQVALSNVGERAADFIYGDERRESSVSQRKEMFLKPGWSPELLLSTNYVGRCWFASAKLVDDSFASFAEFTQASEYDRVLGVTEGVRVVRRVPKLLSERHGEPAEDEQAEIQALEAAAKRRGIQASVEKSAVAGTYRFHRKLVKPGKVSIIIPSIAARGLIKICLESIRTMSTFKDYEIVLIDNIRDDNSEWKPWFRENADKVIEVREDFHWSRFNNIGAHHATGDYLLFLNDDTEVIDPRWMETLMELAQVEDIGAVGPCLLYPDRTVQHAGIFLTSVGAGLHAFRHAPEDEPGYFGLALTQRNVIGVTGACLMVRREVFDALGGFNEAHSIINNDVDFCLRCHDAGLSIVYTPYAKLIHHELVSREKLPETYDAETFSEEWGEIYAKGDPFFHPGLSRSDDHYSIDPECLREVYAGYPIAHRSEIRRIVAFKLDHIGDFITALPALRRLKKHFPEAMLAVVVSPVVAPLAKLEAAIDLIFDFSFFHARSGLGRTNIGEGDLMALKARLAPHQFDLAIDLRKSLDTRHVLQYSGARLLAGFDQGGQFPWLDMALEWEGDVTRVKKRQHVAGDLLNLVDAIANSCEEDRYAVHGPAGVRHVNSPPAVAKLSQTLYGRPVVGIHPASGNELRQWPAEHFAGLIDLLVTRLPVHVALLGGPDEQELANAVLGKVKQRQHVWSLVGTHKLNDLPDVLRSLALFVGNNSGPKHIAAGLGVPTVAVHSAVVSTEEWGPLGPNAVALRKDVGCALCYRVRKDECHRNVACLRDISPEDVYQVCLRFLALADPHTLTGVRYCESAQVN